VIQYVYQKYGRERAAIAATVIRYRPKSAVRDVGKALGLSLDQVDALSKSLSWWDGEQGLSARLIELGFDPTSPQIRQLLWLVKQLLRFPRHLSQHVGGFVISESPLWSLVPVENAAMPDRTIIQWDKDDLDALGLLKVDCLALGMLSAIHRSLDLVAQRQGISSYTMQDVPKEDDKTYRMISRGETIGVFQIESRAQMSMLPRLKPEKFYDLVIQIAIVRPGPIQGGMVHPYLRRRQKLEPVDYPSKELEKVMDRTLGIPLFQEQVMQVAVVAAGFTPGEADQVRRSMAAWQRKGGLEHLQERLVHGMMKNGYTQEFAARIFEMIKGFGDYGFPESHAASFAILAYISAWLKCHEPAAFLAGLLNSQPMGFYQPAQLINDARRAGVEIRPVDVLISSWDCTLEAITQDSAAVRLGFRMVAGLAEEEAQRIANVSGRRAPSSQDELAHRASLSQRALRRLADAGALSRLSGHRNNSRWAALGVERLPGFLSDASAEEMPPELPVPSEGQNLVADFRSMGLTLGRHPLALLRSRLQRRGCKTTAEMAQLRNGQSLQLAGIVTHRQRPETASGVMFVTLEDETGFCQLIVWPSVLETQRRPAILAQLMLIHGTVQIAQGVTHLIADRIEDLGSWLGELNLASRDFR
jgi:error-prone DNA polymerase